MNIPPFLDCDFHAANYQVGAADAATDAMNAIRIALLGAGWSEPGPMYTLKSPARSDIIRFTVQLTRVDANTIRYNVSDHLGRLVNNRNPGGTRQIIPNNAYCNVFCGARYVYHEVCNTTTSFWMAGVLNKEPDPMDIPCPVYFATLGPIDDANGTTTNYYTYWNLWVAASGAGSSLNDLPCWTAINSQPDGFTALGAMSFNPVEVGQGAGWYYGKMPNVVTCDASQWADNTFVVPLTDSVTATFKVVRSGVLGNKVMCVRVA